MKKQIFYISLTCILGSFSLTSLSGMEPYPQTELKHAQEARERDRKSDRSEALVSYQQLMSPRAQANQPNVIHNYYGQVIQNKTTEQIPPSVRPDPTPAQQPPAAQQRAQLGMVQPPAQAAQRAPSLHSHIWGFIKNHPFFTGASALTLMHYLGSQCKPELTNNYPKHYWINLGESLQTMSPASGPSILGRSAQRLFMWWILKKIYEYAWYIKWPEAYYEFHKEIKNIRLAPPNPNQNPNGQNTQIQNNQFLIDCVQYLMGAPDALRRAGMEDEQRNIDRMRTLQSRVCSLPGIAALITYLLTEKQLVRFFELMAQTHPTPSVFTVGSKGIEAATTTRSILQSGYYSLKQGWGSLFKK